MAGESTWRRVNGYAHWSWESDDLWVWGDGQQRGTINGMTRPQDNAEGRDPERQLQWVAVYGFKHWQLIEHPKYPRRSKS